MPAQVFYRKWRPQRFDGVVGQEYVTRTLLNALGTDRVAHAYLLCGPRGTGKTSTGRIMAKALNCLRNGKGEPCNECTMCVAITEGRAIDLIEIDAASNRGIDEMRSLREKVNFAPNEARYKVYIIDEVHMLTEPAFNALLKTLEEPPPHTVFILATTEPEKLPLTVISRCQRFDFRRISLKDVVDRLAKLCVDEDVQATPDVLMAVARGAGGSLRDAENIFEQLVVAYGHHLEMGQLREFLGLGGETQVRQLVAAALATNVAGGLRVIGEAAAEGLDLRQFHRQVMEYLRALLLMKAGAEEAVQQFPDSIQELRAAANTATLDQILRAVKTFGTVDLRSNTYATLPLELALVETALAPATSAATARLAVGASPPLAAPVRPAVPPQVRPPRPDASAPMAPPSQPAPSNMPPAAPVPQRPAAARVEAERPPVREMPPPPTGPPIEQAGPPARPSGAQTPPPQAAAPQPPPGSPMEGNGQGDPLSLLRDNWNRVIEASKAPGQKVKIDVLLRSGEPAAVDAEGVVLAFPYEKFVDMMRSELENPGSRRALEEALASVLGQRRPVRLMVRPKQKRSGGHLLKAAVEMGATVIDEEPS